MFLPMISSPDFSWDFSFFRIRPFQQEFLVYSLLLAFFYGNYYVFVPRFYFHKKWLLFLLAIAGGYALVRFVPEIVLGDDCSPGFEPGPPGFRPPPPPDAMGKGPYFFGHYSFQFLVVALFSLLLRISSRWRLMEQEKTAMELRYLRAQINPHFLFNTLNVIYASSIQEKAKKTAASLIQLSDMLRHVLNESQKEYIPLEQELVYIRAYIALQEQRCGKGTELSVRIEDNSDSWQIPPLLLIPFIENAFKYGVSPEEPSRITIHISLKDDRLTLETRNDKIRRQNVLSEQSGIGVRNTIDRLNRLFQDTYSLTLRETDRFFHVVLILPLKR